MKLICTLFTQRDQDRGGEGPAATHSDVGSVETPEIETPPAASRQCPALRKVRGNMHKNGPDWFPATSLLDCEGKMDHIGTEIQSTMMLRVGAP